MNNRPSDVVYCAVSKENIEQAAPILNSENYQWFKHFIEERHKIFKLRMVEGKPAPWTSDPILSSYRFTNVRRENDRQTRYLIENISTNPALDLPSKVFNTFMFRAWNNWQTMKDFGGPWHWKELANPELKERVRPIYRKLLAKDPDRRWWSAAYNQGGTKYAWKFPDGDGMARAKSEAAGRKFKDYEPDIPLRTFHIGPWLRKLKVFSRIMKAQSQEEVFNIIQEVRGFSTFLAYQVFVDLTYIEEFPFSENEFTVAGPGCRRGIDMVFADRDGMSHEEAIFWMRNHLNGLAKGRWVEEVFSDLPEGERTINVMSLENCFCEISKYLKAHYGTGRPRVKYRVPEQNVEEA